MRCIKNADYDQDASAQRTDQIERIDPGDTLAEELPITSQELAALEEMTISQGHHEAAQHEENVDCEIPVSEKRSERVGEMLANEEMKENDIKSCDAAKSSERFDLFIRIHSIDTPLEPGYLDGNCERCGY
jgi:hypothetical protein